MATDLEIRERHRAQLHDLLEAQTDFTNGDTEAFIKLIRRTKTIMNAEDVAYVYQMLNIEQNKK